VVDDESNDPGACLIYDPLGEPQELDAVVEDPPFISVP